MKFFLAQLYSEETHSPSEDLLRPVFSLGLDLSKFP